MLTYGTIVAQLCKDFDSDYVEVNKQLDKMGYNIGLRLIEDYLAKSNTMKRCANFRETAEMISKVRSPYLDPPDLPMPVFGGYVWRLPALATWQPWADQTSISTRSVSRYFST